MRKEMKDHRSEMREALGSIQQQIGGAYSGGAEGAVTVADDETSPKWCVTLPVKSLDELDVLEQQLEEDEEMQKKMVCSIYISIL